MSAQAQPPDSGTPLSPLVADGDEPPALGSVRTSATLDPARANRERNVLWRSTAVLSQWLFLGWLTLTLGFLWLQAAPLSSQGSLEYLSYLKAIAQGDLGTSAFDGRSVMAIVVAGLPVDLSLTAGAWLAAWIMGAPWGLVAAASPKAGFGWLARVFVSVSVVALVPLCLILTSATERWFMVAGGAALWLPMLVLAVPFAARVARGTQRDAADMLTSDAVFMARASGLPRRRIWLRQVLPVAWRFHASSRLPLAAVFTSVIVIENLLGSPGTGRFFITAARQQDHAVTVGLIMVYTAVFIAAHLAVDLVRAWQGSSRIPTVARQEEAA